MRRIVWSYDREHLLHPFIVQGARTLAEAGLHVTVMSCDIAEGAPYRSNDGFSFARKLRAWTAANGTFQRLKAREKHCRCEATRCARKLSYAWPASQLSRKWRFRLRCWRYRVEETWCQQRRNLGRVLAASRRETLDTWMPYIRAFWRLLWIKADVFVASRPEAAVPTALAAKLRGKRFVYYPFELYGEQVGKSSAVLAAMERIILRAAVDGVITQNEMRARVFVEERATRVTPTIVHNYKNVCMQAPDGRLRTAVPKLLSKRIVLYEGYIMAGRWLDKLAQAAAWMPDEVALVFMGPNKGKWLQANSAILDPLVAEGRLHILPQVSQDQVPAFCADADVGIIIYDDSVRNNLFCEPGKLTDYISVGVPVVAPNFPTIGPIVKRHAIGACFEQSDPRSIADAILRVLEKPKAEWAPALGLACRTLTWETQAPALLAAIRGDSSAPVAVLDSTALRERQAA